MRLRLDLAYDGTDFRGWATQPGCAPCRASGGGPGQVLRLARCAVTCAGRTDAGVHARGQVAHVDLDEAAQVRPGRSAGVPARRCAPADGVLPADMRVRRSEAPDGFDARFSALWRRYAYRVADAPPGRPAGPPPRAGLAAPARRRRDERRRGRCCVGEHDFAAFCKRREGATTIRTLLDLRWAPRRRRPGRARVRADAFCHTMVRSLVGLPARGRGGAPAGHVGRPRCSTARVRDPGVTVGPRTG